MIRIYDKLFDLSSNVQSILNDISVNIANDVSSNIISDPSTNELLVNINTKYYSNTYLNVRLKDQDGSFNLIGDYTTPRDFSYNATQDNTYIKRLIIYIQGTGGVRADRYGSINFDGSGARIYTLPSGGSKQYLTGLIANNASMTRYCYDGTFLEPGAGDEAFTARWSFSKGSTLKLNTGDTFGVELDGDFSITDGGGRFLTYNYFTIQGGIIQ